ncbi:putative TIM-barrel fold metal-dependent hydrolase [Halalkaliarchaeum desulfuricum]|uniref:Putative TIM-barrel fold metal-dependent hydrolase n=1 Tax=Halalkaliarchaeum desulfuricum TaxID=2055893 RepID=A0A343TGY5_9EURY|nr:amidohydrolase [Halalkaliarchaeum desulfuricum]AUX08357.1 putative TIM-barrel fold metal-dependent hydrolase [Halalkaliarchaeum desulfuricum]
MTQAADLVLLDGEIHPFAVTAPTPVDDDGIRAGPDADTLEALAVRNGEIVRTGTTYDVEFLVGTHTDVVDLDGATVVPGFVDAHTHMTTTGRYLVHADLSDAESPGDALDALRARERAVDGDDWVLGFGYDESSWAESRYLAREELDAVSDTQPVAAFREDMHVASVNSVVLDRLRSAMPDDDVETEGGEPTGVLVEEAVDPVYDTIEPGPDETRRLLSAATEHAARLGLTGVHDMVRRSYAPQVYRELALDDELPIRVRLNYWADHLDALAELGLRTNHGSDRVQVGAVKTFTDGSIGGRTAKLSAPYDDGAGTGQWVVSPEELSSLVDRADDLGFQLTVHAIGDEAIDETLDVFEERTVDPAGSRHRIEHLELATDEAIERFGELGVVASVQPNFHKWAVPGGLYESRLGDRRPRTNRLARLRDAGAPLAFGSDGMPLSPLVGIHWAVNAPAEPQRLSVTAAIRAYTYGAVYAGFGEDRLGTIEPGKRADLTVLGESPWESPGRICEIDVTMTVVDGETVYNGREQVSQS